MVYYLVMGHYFASMFDFEGYGMLYFLGMIFIATCLLPVTSIYVMYKYGLIENIKLISRDDRLIPNIMTTSTYVITYFMLRYVNNFSGVIILPLLLMSIVLIVHTVVSIFWKISAHAASGASLLGFWAFMQINLPQESLYYPFLFFIVCIGGLLSARLYLERHSPAQVWVGALQGFCIAVGGVWLYFLGII